MPRVVSFTGSTEVGRRINGLAADSPILKRVLLELGGNSPCVVLSDADLDLAVRGAVFGKFLHQGQICMAINRLIVDALIHDEFVDRFKARVSRLKCGNLEVPIAASYSLGQAAKAHARLAKGHVLGKIVLRVRGR